MAATEPFAVQAEITVATNFWGTLNVCKKLFPLLRPHARLVKSLKVKKVQETQ
jgi:carbonyl reductase 1